MPEQRVYTNRYEIVRHLARGGMAEVYLAHDQLLDRRVALKVLFPEFARDPAFVQRFRREAQSAANLNHPNIVAVFDWGEEDGTYFIVMEYVEGRSLREAIQADGPLYPNLAADLASDIAGALGFAHRNGVVHRDVKPGNILLTPQGQVKVTDFGIARAAGASEGLTQTGSVMGTATYFSPEQAQGLPVDARSDVYSLGVVLYEMVCGVPPVHRGEPDLGGLQARPGGAAPADGGEPRRPRRPGEHHPHRHGQDARRPLRLGRRHAGRPGPVPAGRADLVGADDGRAGDAAPTSPSSTPGWTRSTTAPRSARSCRRRRIPPAPPRRSAAPFVLALVALLAAAGRARLPAGQAAVRRRRRRRRLVTVGNYVGQTENDARLLIEDDGLKADIATEENDQIAGRGGLRPGARPRARSSRRARPSSSGSAAARARCKVPDVTGETLDDAQSRLADAGFQYRVLQETSDSVDAGKVTRTDPAAGALGREGLGREALRLVRQGAGRDPRRRPGRTRWRRPTPSAPRA